VGLTAGQDPPSLVPYPRDPVAVSLRCIYTEVTDEVDLHVSSPQNKEHDGNTLQEGHINEPSINIS